MIVSRSPAEIRLATVADAAAIRDIYNLEVSESTVTFDLVPRTLGAQEEWLREHAGAHPAIVATEDGVVVAFACARAVPAPPAYATTVEDSIYVRRDRQGRGYGRALLVELMRLATSHGFHAVMGRIVDGHEASIALHQKCGFDTVGVEREVGRKFGRWLDVVVMQRLL